MDLEKQLETIERGVAPQVWKEMKPPLAEKLKRGWVAEAEARKRG